jgi:hypothetical protein
MTEVTKVPEKLSKHQDLPQILIVVILTLTCVICGFLYPEPYDFANYDISDFGATISPQGFDNTVSSTIFIIGFLICAIIAFISMKFSEKKSLALCNLLIGIGFIGISFPTNLYHNFHRFSAIFMFFSLWVFLFLNMQKTQTGKALFLELSIINIIYMLFSFHLLEGNSSLWQKIAFINLVGAFLLSKFIQIKSHKS